VRPFRNAKITGSQNEIKSAIPSEKQRRMEFVIYRGAVSCNSSESSKQNEEDESSMDR
jgi:hypothetical protein